jgi:hypothetical protein
MSQKTLEASINAADHVAEAAVALLKFCRESRGTLSRAASTVAGAKHIRDVFDRAVTWIGDGAPILSDISRATILSYLRDAPSPELTARGLVVALEAVCARDIKAYLGSLPSGPVSYGDPIGTPIPDLRQRLPGHAHYTTSRSGLPRVWETDTIPSMTLATRAMVSNVSVVIDRRAGVHLDAALGDAPINLAAAHVNVTEAEFHDVATDQATFFGVTIRDPDVQKARIDALITLAVTKRANILVLPELCRDAATTANVLERITERPSPPIVFAGTQHEVDCGRQVNRGLVMYARGGYIVQQDKFAPVRLARKGGPAGAKCEEELDSGRELVMHAGSDSTLISLTCADLLAPAVLDLVCDLCPTIVLVASMTDKLSGFEAAALALVARTQALVVVANNVSDRDGELVDAAVFARPVESCQLSTVPAQGVPGLAVLPARATAPSWFPI